MPEPLTIQQTVHYKTYVKAALVEALRPVFVSHADEFLRDTKVDIDFPMDQAAYPAIVIRFYERDIKNAGVGHFEWLEDPTELGKYHKFKHYLYDGDIEFAVYALSSMDRDLVSDSLVQILTMGELEAYTNQFFQRIYAADPVTEPNSKEHFVNLNTDKIQGFGESQVMAPWMTEDTLVYQVGYRIGIMGEFYSLVPETAPTGLVEYVEIYPYMGDLGEPKPDPNPEDPTPWSGG